MSDLIRLPDDFRNDKDRETADEAGALIAAPRRSRVVASLGAIALLLAFGWGAGAAIDHLRGPGPEQQAAQQAAKAATEAAAKALAGEEARKQEIAALRGQVEHLKIKLDAQAQQAHASDGAVVALQKTIAEQKAEAAATAAQLQAKIDHLQTQAAQIPAGRPAEKHADKPMDHTPVASIAKGHLNAEARALPKPLTPYRAFVLRDVNRGLAVVESRNGLEEVGPGDVLPGGARVDRLEKRGAAWVVVTDRGYIASGGAIATNRRWED